MKADNLVVEKQISDTLTLTKHILGEDLLGLYVYGSLLMGGLQKFSDIDLFAISNRETTLEEKEQFEKALLKISGIYGVSKDLKPIELTIVTKANVKPWHYPPKFDFLYGDWLRADFEVGTIEPWPTKVHPNLALVITQLLLSNKIVYGSNPKNLLDPVPYKDFIHATTSEIDSLLNDIDWDTRNVLLTLARIWSTVETDSIRSKADAASWAIEKLPEAYSPVLMRAKAILLGQQEENWNDFKTRIESCASFMVEQIKRQMSVIESDYSNRSITLN